MSKVSDLLIRIANALTGRTLHWSTINNALVAELVSCIKDSPAPIGILLDQLLLASYLSIDALISPLRGSERILKIDIKGVTRGQMLELYRVHTFTLASIFCHANPAMRNSVLSACEALLGVGEREKQITSMVLNLDRIEAAKINGLLITEIQQILHLSDFEFSAWFQYSLVWSSAYSQSIERFWKSCSGEAHTG